MEKKLPTPDYLREFLASWGEKFLKLPQFSMDNTVSKCYVSCCLSESDPEFPSLALRNSFPYQVALKRANAINLNITPAVITMLCVLANNPGKIVMYLYALKHFQIRDKLKVINTSALAMAFPMGFPDDLAMSEIWDSQKGYVLGFSCDNLLDHITGELLA